MIDMPDPLPEGEPTEEQMNLDEEGEQPSPARAMPVPVSETSSQVERPATIDASSSEVPSEQSSLQIPGFPPDLGFGTGLGFKLTLPKAVGGGDIGVTAGSTSSNHGLLLAYAVCTVLGLLVTAFVAPAYLPYALIGFFVLLMSLIFRSPRGGDTNG